jgi:acyl-CoA thioester hydrolase
MARDSVVTYRGTVYPSQCDHMGHMNVMWYVGKFDEGSWQLLAILGLTPSRLRSEGHGMAAVEQRIEYKRELYAGDIVTVRSAVLEVREKSIRIAHEMQNDDTGSIAATTVVVAVHLDLASRRVCSLPADVRERGIVMMDNGTAVDRRVGDHEVERAVCSAALLSV